jgi:cytoskeletal protein CcmA (bactofilin family)
MFRKNNIPKPIDIGQQEISTIISEDFIFNGQIEGKAVIRIDGQVIGNVKVGVGIILGEKSVVKGDIETKSAIIYGTVTGNVKVNHLEIKKTGKVNGDIKTETLEIELGAQYNGKLEMKQLINTIEEKV